MKKLLEKIIPKKETPLLPESLKNFLKAFFLVALFFIILGVSSIIAFEYYFQDKIFPNVEIDRFSVSNKTPTQALTFIEDKIDQINNQGFIFYYQKENVKIYPTVISTSDPDFTYQILSFNTEKMVNQAYKYGRSQDFFTNFKKQLGLIINPYQINIDYQLNKEELKTALQESFSKYENPGSDAQIQIDELGKITIEPEKMGESFDYQKTINTFEKELNLIETDKIVMIMSPHIPQVTAIQAQAMIPQIENILDLKTIILNNPGIATNNQWKIEKQTYKDWLELVNKDDKILIQFNQEDLKNFLTKLSKEINIEPQDGKLIIENEKVTEFTPSIVGQELNIEESINTINREVFENKNNNIELVINQTEPAVPMGSINNLGINEIIGVGSSDFSGSPRNRVHNINTGAAALNGILVAPGEEFSTIEALGDINAASGYLPELVIKGNKTIPEYGGGLCQIGTTIFRVALDAGLPITERRNHSYRVPYYEPAGTDATIYDPHPDLRFINDTEHYILIHTKVENPNLYFEIWGTSDGRKTIVNDPVIYNITAPPPTKIVPSPELAPGEKKCTERAHYGADADFTRSITFLNGEVKEETWHSHYQAWPAVCLVGQEEVITEEIPNTNEDDPASATDNPIEETTITP